MRLLYTLFTLAVGGYGLFWLAEKNPDLKQKVEELLDFRKTPALEMRYDATQVMETHQSKLLKERGMRFLTPELKFYPHLLLEVKYCDAFQQTKEGWILWDLTDGEMVLDSKTWEKTHGFADCILTNTLRHEFKILHILAEFGGMCDQQTLMESLGFDKPVMDALVKGCIKKNLIVQTESGLRLHLDHPKLAVIPETKLYEPLTSKIHKRAERAERHFSKGQIERIVQMAFGESFSIRSTTQIYLPVHRLVIQKQDGSVYTAHFNALTGKELPTATFYR